MNHSNCFEKEADAFLGEAVYLSQLNDEERRSIFTRLANDESQNPAFEITLLFDEIHNETFSACEQVRNTNLLTEEQFNECYWQGFKNQLKQVVASSNYYQEQCKAEL